MEDAARQKVLGLVGLGVRGRLVVVGIEQVKAAAKKGKLFLALVAPDISKNSLDRVMPLLTARRVRVLEGLSAKELGAATGRDTTGAVGVVDRALAGGIMKAAG